MVTTTSGSVIATAGETFTLSSLFNIPSGDASILLLLTEDNVYSAYQPGTLGYFSGNGELLKIDAETGETLYTDALFTYNSATGVYSNSQLGNLADLSYRALGGSGHNETLTLSPSDGAPVSLSITTGTSYAALSNATPSAISSIALGLVGQVWSVNSCWLLAADISARAGASLPLSSNQLSPPGNPTLPTNNGEWIVAYNGEIQTNPSYAGAEAVVRPGDVIVMTWAGGTDGHVATAVSGFGAATQVIDDWNFGTNMVQDRTGLDLTLAAAHSLDGELNGTLANPVPGGPIAASIQIYRLDTPTITILNQASIVGSQSISLAPLFSVQDAGGAGKLPITSYAFYDSDGAFISNGAVTLAHSADQKIVVSADAMPSLLLEGPAVGSDVVYVSAYNGQYWGDWSSLTVTVTGPPDLSDSAAHIQASLDQLEQQVVAKTVGAITLSDDGTPNITVTSAQFSDDRAALNDITSPHSVTVEVSGTAAQHDFSSDNWTGATALQFADQTVIVAAVPGPANAVTTGNITELYAAVFSREPDVGGLAFYQAYLQKNPATALQTFADYFLNSTEYKSSHSYEAGTAGDTQFIEDSYQNLLHRTPSADEVSFYLNNVMSKPDAHALMLVYFSASPEFLGTVQITAQTPASVQHWLLLI